MAHIEIKIDTFSSKINIPDAKLKRILDAYMETAGFNLLPITDIVYSELSAQEQINIALQVIFIEISERAKERKITKMRIDYEKEIETVIKEFETANVGKAIV